MKHHFWLVGALALGLTGCASTPQGHAVIEATDPRSTISGTALFSKKPAGVKAVIAIAGAPPGAHAIHIHEHGRCDESGKAAGGHFNPENAKHGFLPHDGPSGAHAGDMGNIEVNARGRGRLKLHLPGLTLDQGPLGIAGRSVIVHEKVDDFGQPTGNAGGRIGCGVILAADEHGVLYTPQ